MCIRDRYRRGEEELKPPPSLLAFDVDQVVQATPGGPGSGAGLAPVEHTTPAGADSLASQAGASSGGENPRTTLVEDVRDNVDPVVHPGGEETRDFDLGLS